MQQEHSFEYLAYTQEGKKISGTLLASHLDDAKKQLIDEDLFLIKIKRLKNGHTLKFNNSEKLQWAKLFLQLLEASLPVFESLKMLELQNSHKKKSKQQLLQQMMIEKLKSGLLLSDVMLQFPKCFEPIFVAMIKGAESSGQLEFAVKSYIELLEKRLELRKKLVSLTIYPVVVSLFSLGALILLLVVAIPSLKNLIPSENLNILSKTIFALSDFLIHSYDLILLALLLLIFVLLISIRKKGVDYFLFKIPFLKTIFFERDLFLFSQNTSNLLKSHLPLFDSLQLSRGLLKNPQLKEVFLRVEEKITQGQLIAQTLANEKNIDSILVQILKVGQESASLDKSFSNIAKMMQEKMEKKLTKILGMLQPLLIVFLGIFVGLIMLSILIPLTDAANI